MLNALDFQRAEPYIAAALRYAGDTHTVADVAALIAADYAQLWSGPAAAVVTQLIADPQQTRLHFFLAGGNRADLAALLPTILDWGRAQGATKAALVGRKGWQRMPFLVESGWHAAELVIMEKDLR